LRTFQGKPRQYEYYGLDQDNEYNEKQQYRVNKLTRRKRNENIFESFEIVLLE